MIAPRGITRSVVVVGDRLLDEHGNTIGSSGFYTVTEAVDSVADLTAFRGATEQANGTIAYRILADRAFDVLVWCSQQANVKLRNIPEQLLTRVTIRHRRSLHLRETSPHRFDNCAIEIRSELSYPSF